MDWTTELDKTVDWDSELVESVELVESLTAIDWLSKVLIEAVNDFYRKNPPVIMFTRGNLISLFFYATFAIIKFCIFYQN